MNSSPLPPSTKPFEIVAHRGLPREAPENTIQSFQRARLAQARAVHLHPTQLTEEIIAAVYRHGIQVHAWDVNDVASLELVTELGIPRLCSDDLRQALAFREGLTARQE